MDPDNLKQAWQTQSSPAGLTIDAELLVKEVRRSQHYFTALIYWRDVREVGAALLLVPLWLYLGVKFSLPWTWYLTVPVLGWVAAYMLADRVLHSRQPPEPGEPLRQHLESSLAQIEHQIWLLGNVLWWYLLPLALSMLAFVCHVAWQVRSGGWLMAVVVAGPVVIGVIILVGVYRLNQDAVRTELVPRRQELEALLRGLADEGPAVSSNPKE
jgi:hypothetical protein